MLAALRKGESRLKMLFEQKRFFSTVVKFWVFLSKKLKIFLRYWQCSLLLSTDKRNFGGIISHILWLCFTLLPSPECKTEQLLTQNSAYRNGKATTNFNTKNILYWYGFFRNLSKTLKYHHEGTFLFLLNGSSSVDWLKQEKRFLLCLHAQIF